jgi:hypothetical protein
VVDSIHKPLKLYCDNALAVQYAHNNRSSGAAKHIDIKYYVVKDKVRDQIISLELFDPGLIPSQRSTLCQCVWQHHLTYCCEHII